MAFGSCVSCNAPDSYIQALCTAVKEDASTALEGLLSEGILTAYDLNKKHLLHEAAWRGNFECVQLLLQNGASASIAHKKNGCTPLHLAHFLQVERTNPLKTIKLLLEAGAYVNDTGSDLCGKLAIDHAICHQRLDSVQILIQNGSFINVDSVLLTIDVINPVILETLLMSGSNCGKALPSIVFWGKPFHRLVQLNANCPKGCFKSMLECLVQATVCIPSSMISEIEAYRLPSNIHLVIESTLRALAKYSTDNMIYLYSSLLKNGFWPTSSIKLFVNSVSGISWFEKFLQQPPDLQSLCVRIIRSYIYFSGNILFGAQNIHCPDSIKQSIISSNTVY